MGDFGELFGALVEGVTGLFGEGVADAAAAAVVDGAPRDPSAVYERVLTGVTKPLGVNDR